MSASPIPLDRLSHVLRTSTAALHRQTELALDLPASIRSMDDYRRLLQRFYSLYAPLEELLAAFPDWQTWGIAPPERQYGQRLARDLRALGVAPEDLPLASPSHLPMLPGFGEALGARYVLEGSALGSQVILPLLQGKLGAIDGANDFLLGDGPRTWDRWNALCLGLDVYGAQPGANPQPVCDGALATFAAVGAWMKPPPQPSLPTNLVCAPIHYPPRNKARPGNRLDLFP